MILYFSGTGNSEYIAEKIGEEFQDETINLFEKIKNHDYSSIQSDRPWIIVTPTYAWRIPRIVEEWLRKTLLLGNQKWYFVMSCGGNIGNAGKYLNKLSRLKKMQYLGCYPIKMPEKYIALFTTPNKDEAHQLIQAGQQEVMVMLSYLKNNQSFPIPTLTFMDKLNSGIVNDIFYPLLVHAKKFYASDACITCGICEAVCPLNNIQI